MRIEKSFTVKSARPNVWAFLTDPHRVARALPGAAIQEQIDPQTYAGTITVKVGPVATSYKGRCDSSVSTRQLASPRSLRRGQDVRGKGGAELRMTSTVVERGPRETEVAVVSDVNITGILAQMGRGMIEQVSDQMFQIFTDAVRAELETAAPAPDSPPAFAAAPVMAGARPHLSKSCRSGVSSCSTRLDAPCAGPQSSQCLLAVAILVVWLSLR